MWYIVSKLYKRIGSLGTGHDRFFCFDRARKEGESVLKNKTHADSRGLLRGIECTLEVVLLCILYYFVWRYGYEDGLFPDYFFNGKYVLAGVYGVLIVLLFNNLDGFLFDQKRFTDLLIGQSLALIIVNCLTYFQLCLIANHMISVLPILMLTVIDFVMAGVLVYVYKKFYQKFYAPHNMILIFGSDNAVGIKLKLDTRKDKYNVKKLMSIDEGFDNVCAEIRNYDAVILNDLPPKIRNNLLKFCYSEGIRTYAVPKISDIMMRGGKAVNLFDTPLLCLSMRGMTLAQRIAKRAMDIVLSLIALILASPILLVVAIAIKLEDGGPVFYKQKRLTVGDKEFEILKFRSMVPNAEKLTGAVWSAGENDPRITKVGRFVRATRFDELPQIINILKGDMSVVGPRPERRVFVDQFCQEMPEFAFRTKVKGGLTGYAQVYGKYNTTPYDKLRFDLMYIENYSLLLDIKLIILTFKIIFSKESTEGMEAAEENEKKKSELLNQIQENQEIKKDDK